MKIYLYQLDTSLQYYIQTSKINHLYQFITKKNYHHSSQHPLPTLLKQQSHKFFILYLLNQINTFQTVLNQIFALTPKINQYRKFINKSQITKQFINYTDQLKNQQIGLIFDPIQQAIQFFTFQTNLHHQKQLTKLQLNQFIDQQKQSVFMIQVKNIKHLIQLNNSINFGQYNTLINEILKCIKKQDQQQQCLLPSKQEQQLLTTSKSQEFQNDPIILQKQILAVSQLILKNKEIMSLKRTIKLMCQELSNLKKENMNLHQEIQLMRVKNQKQNQEQNIYQKITKKKKNEGGGIRIQKIDRSNQKSTGQKNEKYLRQQMKIYQNKCKKLQIQKEKSELKLHMYQKNMYQLQKTNTLLQDQLNSLKFKGIYFQN